MQLNSTGVTILSPSGSKSKNDGAEGYFASACISCHVVITDVVLNN